MMKYLFLIFSLFGLTACYEDVSVTLHQAGAYKGKADSHSQTADQREAILAKRFNLIQTDR